MEHRVQTGSVNARRAVQQAYAYLSLAQDQPLREIAAGAFVMFAALCEELRMSPAEAYARGAALLRNGDLCREVAAMRDTLNHIAKHERGDHSNKRTAERVKRHREAWGME